MMTSKTLADIARHITILEIRCSRCDLSGRMNVAKLIDQYGGRDAVARPWDDAGG
jgi:hypothetical protein